MPVTFDLNSVLLILNILAIVGAGASVTVTMIKKVGARDRHIDDLDERVVSGEKADERHRQAVEDMERRHQMEMGRLTDLANSADKIMSRQEERILGLDRWVASIDERVKFVERQGQGRPA